MRALLLVIAFGLFLAGCQSLPPQTASSTAEPSALTLAKQHRANLTAFSRWQAKGKIKITVRGDNQSASFDWQQFKKNYAINFFGPLGYGNSWLRRTSQGVTLQTPSAPIQRAKTAEQLLMDAAGWQIPISGLQYWIKGLPVSGPITEQQLTPFGAYAAIKQQGWTIHLSRHKQYGELWLPGKVIASRQGVSVLIIIKQWEP